MTKRLVSMILALSMMLSLVPVSAFADTGGEITPDTAASPQAVEEENADSTAADATNDAAEDTASNVTVIEIGTNGKPTTEQPSDGSWTFANNRLTLINGTFKLTGSAGYVTIEKNAVLLSGTLSLDVDNYGIIKDCTYNPYSSSFRLSNKAGATIEGGTFTGKGYVYNYGTFENVTSTDTVTVYNYGAIISGIFGSPVTNYGTIAGGTFSRTVKNSAYTNFSGTTYVGTIAGGTFNDGVENNAGAIIDGGTFAYRVTNYSTVKGGTFKNGMTNYGTIKGGTFTGGAVQNPNPTDGSTGGVIEGGTFQYTVYSGSVCTIKGGTFTGVVTGYATIEGGLFKGTVNVGAIKGGWFVNTVTGVNTVKVSGLKFQVPVNADGTEWSEEVSSLYAVRGTEVTLKTSNIVGTVTGATVEKRDGNVITLKIDSSATSVTLNMAEDLDPEIDRYGRICARSRTGALTPYEDGKPLIYKRWQYDGTTLTITGNVTVNGTFPDGTILVVDGSASYAGLNSGSSGLTVPGKTTIKAANTNPSVSNISFNGPVTVEGEGEIQAYSTFNDTVTVNGPVELKGGHYNKPLILNKNTTLTNAHVYNTLQLASGVTCTAGALERSKTVYFGEKATVEADAGATLLLKNALFVDSTPAEGSYTMADGATLRTIKAEDFTIGSFTYVWADSSMGYDSTTGAKQLTYTAYPDSESTSCTLKATGGTKITMVNGAPLTPASDSLTITSDMFDTNNTLTLSCKSIPLEIQDKGDDYPGYPVGYNGGTEEMVGTGWVFDPFTMTLTITGTIDLSDEPEVKVRNVVVEKVATLIGGTYSATDSNASVRNHGTLKGSGVFHVPVNNYGTIEGGTFTGKVYNYTNDDDNTVGTINDGTFTEAGHVYNPDGVIAGGTFDCPVDNGNTSYHGTITGGTFKGQVNNDPGSTISGGTFAGKVYNKGTIANGKDADDNVTSEPVFRGDVENVYEASIEGGRFYGNVTNGTFKTFGSISGGIFEAGSVLENKTYIYGGTFKGTVNNVFDWGVIYGGTFSGTVNNHFYIYGGTFTKDATVTNANDGYIYNSSLGGKTTTPTFNGVVENSGQINGGLFNDVVNDHGNYVIQGGIFMVPTLDDVEVSFPSEPVEYGEVEKKVAAELPFPSKYHKFADAKVVLDTEDGKVPTTPGTYTFHVEVTCKDDNATVKTLTNDSWTFTIKGTPLEFDYNGKPLYKNAPHEGTLYTGQGWTYDEDSGILTIDAAIDLSKLSGYHKCSVDTNIYADVTATDFIFSGKTVSVSKRSTLTGANLNDCAVTNFGTLANCTTDEDSNVTNYGTIASGTYNGSVDNRTATNGTDTFPGIISGGTFTNNCVVTNNGSITGGTFSGTVKNYSTIDAQNADFNGTVNNYEKSTIKAGTFTKTVTNVGTIAGGTFAESSTVTSRHSITGGEFRGKVNNSNGIISGGIFTSTSEVTNNGQIQAAENEMSEPTFLGKVTNDTSGMIHAGQFDGTVTNSGYISGGTFTATSDVTNNASITSGTFECPVTNNDSISGGEFKDTVTNSANGTILGESIFHKVVENSGTIRGGTFEDAVNDYEGFTITGGVFKTPTLDDIELHTVSSTDKLQYGEVSKNLKVSIPEAKKYKFANASFEIKNEDGDVVDDYSMPGTYTYHVVVTDYDLLPKTHVLTDDAWTFTIEGTPLEFDSDGVPVYGNAPHDADGINYYGEGWTYDCVNHVLTLDASIVLSQLNGYKTCSVYTKITSPDEDDPTQAVTVDATGFTFSEDVSVGKNCTLIGATLNGKMSVYNEGTLTDCTAAAVCTVTNNGTIASGSYSGYVYNYDTIAGGSFRGYVTNQGSITSGTFSYGVSNEGKGTITGGNFITGSSVSNSSIISGGSFLGEVNNNDTGTITATETTTPDFTGTVNNGGKIEDGTFSGIVKNSNTITGGSYDNTVLNAGTIQDGTFLRDVENAGTIAGGEFRGKVNNKEGAAITGGTFTEDGSVVNDGDITKSADGTTGTFKGPVENNGTISAGTFTNFVTGDGKITGGNFIPMAIDLTVENIPEEPVAPSALNLFPKLNNDEKFDPDSLTILYEKVGTTVQAYASVRDDLADNDDEAYTETAPTIPGTYKFRVQLKDNAGTTYTVKNDAWQFTIKGEPLHIVDGEPDLTFAATEDGKTYYGDGWVYDKDEKELTLTGDITFADNTTEIDVDVDVAKGATVSGGRFMENVSNKGTIEGATFEKKVTNEGTISDSHLSGSASMDNKTTGRITDTTFTSSVITNEGSIIGGSVDGGTLVDNGKMTDVEGVTTISGTGGDIYVNGTEETLKGHSVLTGDSIKLVAHDEENFVRWIIDSDGRELGGADFGLDTEENFQAKITQPEFTFTVKSDWRTVNFMVQQPASDDASLQEIAMGVGLATVAVGGAVFIYEAATTRYLYDHLPDHAVPATRAELALVLWQAAGKPEPAAPAVYSDVTDADTAKAARWAVEAGLISDKGETTFAPNRRITKIQAIQAWNKLQKSSK